MANLKELFDSNVNIMEYFRKNNNTDYNSSYALLASYDQQAGSYIKMLESDEIRNNYHVNSVQTPMTHKKFVDMYCSQIAKRLEPLDFETVLDAGIGEATILLNIAKHLNNKQLKFYGFDISASRIKVAKEYCKTHSFSPNLFVCDMKHIPLQDNSIDLVYTNHAVEPNTNKEYEIISELFRVCKKYLVMCEPSYELGNPETKANIEKHKYIKNLKQAVDALDGKLLKYELLPVGTFANQPAIYIIEKNHTRDITNNKPGFACPVCRKKLLQKNGENFCENCGLVYPIIDNIEILNPDNSIIFSKF